MAPSLHPVVFSEGCFCPPTRHTLLPGAGPRLAQAAGALTEVGAERPARRSWAAAGDQGIKETERERDSNPDRSCLLFLLQGRFQHSSHLSRGDPSLCSLSPTCPRHELGRRCLKPQGFSQGDGAGPRPLLRSITGHLLAGRVTPICNQFHGRSVASMISSVHRLDAPTGPAISREQHVSVLERRRGTPSRNQSHPRQSDSGSLEVRNGAVGHPTRWDFADQGHPGGDTIHRRLQLRGAATEMGSSRQMAYRASLTRPGR